MSREKQIDIIESDIKTGMRAMEISNPRVYRGLTYRLVAEHLEAIGYRRQSEGEWVKQKPDPEAMKVFHEKGLGNGMSVNSIYWTCSVCDNWGTPHHKYCSSCGAKMKGGE